MRGGGAKEVGDGGERLEWDTCERKEKECGRLEGECKEDGQRREREGERTIWNGCGKKEW